MRMNDEQNRTIALAIFGKIQTAFPKLAMDLHLHPEHVDLELLIPTQSGLTVPVKLNLQGDELHMNAASFWLEWFPCHNEVVQARYFRAVTGFLSGELRILEYRRGNRVVKAVLQEPDGNEWKTIGRYLQFHWPFPWKKTVQEIRNAQPSA